MCERKRTQSEVLTFSLEDARTNKAIQHLELLTIMTLFSLN